jgi:TRAP transporter 4TM/12TM fusion protein
MKGLPESEIPRTITVLKGGWHFILPVVALVIVLVLGYSPARSAFVGMGILIVTSMIKASTRIGVKDFWEILSSAGKSAVGIVAACACAGMIVGVTSMTGVGVKLATMIEVLSSGHLIVALLLTAVASLILGMALPTTPNYIVQASVAAPALIALGIPKLTAHLFVFYFGVYADITPPVALAAYTAAGIAKSDPMMTGVTASRNVIVGFIVPFLFVYYPGLVMQGSPWEIVNMTASTAFGIIAYSSAFCNFLYRVCNVWERVALFFSGILLITPGLTTDSLGLAILVTVYLRQKMTQNRRLKLSV